MFFNESVELVVIRDIDDYGATDRVAYPFHIMVKNNVQILSLSLLIQST